MNASKAIAENHNATQDKLEDYADSVVHCDFCLRKTTGVQASQVINSKYFNDSWAKQKDEDMICAYCATCMKTKDIQRGHWHAQKNRFQKISTGGLYEYIKENNIDRGFFHFTSSPIKNSHAYLWTKKKSYDKSKIPADKEKILGVVNLVERLRRNGFTLKEISSQNAKVRNIESLGAQEWMNISQRLKELKTSTLLSVATTISRSKSDQ